MAALQQKRVDFEKKQLQGYVRFSEAFLIKITIIEKKTIDKMFKIIA